MEYLRLNSHGFQRRPRLYPLCLSQLSKASFSLTANKGLLFIREIHGISWAALLLMTVTRSLEELLEARLFYCPLGLDIAHRQTQRDKRKQTNNTTIR
jgi:hypothetical protein